MAGPRRVNGSTRTASRFSFRAYDHAPAIRPSTRTAGESQPAGRYTRL